MDQVTTKAALTVRAGLQHRASAAARHVRAVLAGIGSYLPAQVVTNDDLAQRVDTSDTWIRERTGIGQRHIAASHETCAYMGTHAARAALADAGIGGAELDCIVLATATPHHAFPATAVPVHDQPGDRVTNGGEVFRHAVIKLSEAVTDALPANGLTHAEIDWLVPHQANLRIIEAIGRRLDLDADRVVVPVDRHANTSAASIPLALSEAYHDGRIKRGQLALMEALGGGLTWGAALVRM